MTDEEWNNDPRTQALIRECEELELAQHVLSVTVMAAAKARKMIADWVDDITGLDVLPRSLMDAKVLPKPTAPPRSRASARASLKVVG